MRQRKAVSDMEIHFPKCIDTRKCFARNKFKDCTILKETWPRDGACKFCKAEKEVTNGRRYPLRQD